jgi:CRISPR-associated protein Cas5d
LTTIKNGGTAPLYFADDDRAQRNTVALSDVDYVIEAHFTMTNSAGSDDNMNKFVEMFNRRVAKGQHFHQPYFGCREFVAEVLTADEAPPAIAESLDLGLMLWDIRFSGDRNTPIFFPARLNKGVLEVPPASEGATLATVGMDKGGEA